MMIILDLGLLVLAGEKILPCFCKWFGLQLSLFQQNYGPEKYMWFATTLWLRIHEYSNIPKVL